MVSARGAFCCPPGLEVPPKLFTERRIAIEDRQEKREEILNVFKREPSYTKMAMLRKLAGHLATPDEEPPCSPSTAPHYSKREFEGKFRNFKRWAEFVDAGHARPKEPRRSSRQ